MSRAAPGIAFNQHITGDGAIIFQHACKLGLEGIVSKRKNSRYISGRSLNWIKLKNPQAPAARREIRRGLGQVEGLSHLIARLRLSRVVGGLLIFLSLIAGYLFAGWWYGFGAQDVTALRQICARVDYLDGLQEALPEQLAPPEEIRNEFSMLVEQCREALGEQIEQNE